MKLNQPSKEIINQRLAKFGLSPDYRIKLKDIEQYMQKLTAEKFLNFITEDGFGSALYLQLKSDNGMDLFNLATFILIEENNLEIVKFIN